jgi:hypothetical protein
MSADRDRPVVSCDAPSAELARIVIEAGRRGFPRWRVATALGISGLGLARIEQGDTGTGDDARHSTAEAGSE